MSTPYYNTNHEQGEQHRQSVLNAMSQENAALLYMMEHPDQHFTPDEIWQAVMPNAPRNSAMRSLTNMTDRNEIEKTHVMGISMYGKKVHTWRLKQQRRIESNGQIRLF